MSEQTPITGSFIWMLEDAKLRHDILTGRPITLKGKLVVDAFIVILILALFVFVSVTNRVNFHSFFFGPFIIIVSLAALILMYLFLRYNESANIKKGFLLSPDHDKRVDVTVTKDEIIMKVEGISENKWNWNTIKEVQQSPKGFCFFLAKQTGFWIPIRAFASQADIDSMVQLARQLSREKPFLKYTDFI